jgi:glutamyl-tRNA synthetase
VPAPRVRIAPSPTGFFHVGTGRTALYNWLFARRHGGTFILRIEDTDAERNREEWVDGIVDALSWLGMEPDEGPYRQSERRDLYQAALDALWDAGNLYACDCTRDEVVARTAGRATPGYDGHCRNRALSREGHALRFRTPDTGETLVHDLVRGDVTFRHETMEDFVVARSSGEPLFVLANIVDDRDMRITHVIRGEELLPSAPKAVLIWEALETAQAGADGTGAADAGEVVGRARPQLPVWAHLPMLVNEHRQKLSKRRDAVAVELYRDQGFLAEALRNYLALLGWSPPGDDERVPVEVLIDNFTLRAVNHSPAFFDVKKLTHMNGEYIRELSVEHFIERTRPWVNPWGERAAGRWVPGSVPPPPWPPERFDEAVFVKLAPVIQERVTTLGEVPGLVDFVFLEEPPLDDPSWEKAITSDPEAPALLDAAINEYVDSEWTSDALRAATLRVGERMGRKLAKAQAPIRVAVTGRAVGPPLFESLEVLGRSEVLRRLRTAAHRARGA